MLYVRIGMSDITESNKRIAKNTLLLYVRMILTMAVGLFTSRVIINTLGVNDYGVYNVVGGIVTMISFLNNSMASASQRFISFELGKGNQETIKQVFSTSVSTHLLLALVLFVVAETVGLWFLNAHMNIETSRMTAANWVYQCSIISLMLTIVSVPYNACIIAHEHMKAYAYISILEVILKLLIVYLLLIISHDKLIIYAVLVLIVALIVRIIYSMYCKYYFKECIYSFDTFDKRIFRDMFSFVGWNLLGTSSFVFKNQGANIVLNLFFGTAINAARGIAFQVNAVITSFSNNFLMALKPQITKQYAEGNIERSISLVYAGCRYSTFLMMLISIPFMINMDYLLRLWLGIVPPYTSIFLQFTLAAALFRTMELPLITATYATGKIRLSQLIIAVTNFSEIPIVYILLKAGGAPYTAMYPTIIITFINVYAYIWCLKRVVPGYKLGYFVKNIILRSFVIAAICYCLSMYMRTFFSIDFQMFLLTSFLAFLITSLVIYTFGFSRKEQKMLQEKSIAYFLTIYRRFFN